MKHTLPLLLLLHSCTPCPAITPEQIERLIPALIAVESNGVVGAVGDGGKAVGVLQIWPVMVQDVNRISGKQFTLADRLSPEKSEEMARIYFLHYGKKWTVEQSARSWNGGQNGWKKDSTLAYWEKVKKEMEK